MPAIVVILNNVQMLLLTMRNFSAAFVVALLHPERSTLNSQTPQNRNPKPPDVQPQYPEPPNANPQTLDPTSTDAWHRKPHDPNGRFVDRPFSYNPQAPPEFRRLRV